MQRLERRGVDWTLVGLMLMMAFGYVLIYDLMRIGILSNSPWDSYTLQAMAWREGRLDLGQDYAWLELAVYQGKYFVSFPPLPTLVMLPLTFVFGAWTPSYLVVAAYAMIGAAIAYRCLRHIGQSAYRSAFWALFIVWGSNMMWMSTNGGVWFQAQGLNMLLCLLAVYLALKGRRALCYAALALAVGCRPFSLVYMPVAFVYFLLRDKEAAPQRGIVRIALSQWRCYIAPALILGAYLAFNAARFSSPFEFGHNYLPEFTRSQLGQFSFQYVLENAMNLLRPPKVDPGGNLAYPIHNGFLFFAANPVFLIHLAQVGADLVKRRMTAFKWTLLCALTLNLFVLLMHKTLGGWQFGARYMVDLIPFVFFYMLLDWPRRYRRAAAFIAAAGMLFNAYGALAMHFLHG